ncbi:MAG: ribonuclease J, partial [Candidatus Colwellbacteria bacterium]|nr:ribonuclease J [Candidatus Colwellbacteria bacterium]
MVQDRRRQSSPRPTVRRRVVLPSSHGKKKEKPSEEPLRLVPLGGLEEIGRNMAFFEYKDEIVLVDMGIQFPEEETPGIDFIIPNITYLETKKKNILGLILTHGHFDHIGAIPYLIGKLGNPTVYTAKLTKAIIQKRQEEFVNAPKLNVVAIDNGDKMKIGKYMELEFFGVDHTIPDSCGVVIKTPIGNIVHAGDFRVDYDDEDNPKRIQEFKHIGSLGIHTFMVDSTNAEEP